MEAGKAPKLSIVVTSYSTVRINDIFELLDSIKKQTYPNVETVFVAERSRELFQRIKAYAEENSIPNVTVVFNDGESGLSAARNLGIRHATGDIIGFVDDDVVLFPDWAEGMMSAQKGSSAIGVTGPALPLWEDESLKWLPEEFYWLISCIGWTKWRQTRTVRGAFGANMAFKREAFDDNCLFSLNAGYTSAHKYTPVSDDLEFSLRVRRKTGRSIIFSPEARVWHRVHMKRLGLRYVTAKSQEVGRCRRKLRRLYANEFGPLEQEQQVLKGILRILLRTPVEFISRPRLTSRKVFLINAVLISIVVGYLVPIPLYAPVKQKQVVTG